MATRNKSRPSSGQPAKNRSSRWKSSIPPVVFVEMDGLPLMQKKMPKLMSNGEPLPVRMMRLVRPDAASFLSSILSDEKTGKIVVYLVKFD